jgi:MFS family permease
MLEEVRGNYKAIYGRIGVLGFVALVDTSMISPVIASHARFLGADSVTAGVVAGLYSAVALPMIALSGLLSDRLGRRRLLAAGLAGDLLAMLTYMFASSPLHLLLARVAHAVCDSFIVPPALALLGDSFRERVAGPLSVFWVFVATAIVLGSGSASALVASLGFVGIYIVVTALLAVSLLMVRGLPSPKPASSTTAPVTLLLRKNWARLAASMLTMLGIYLLIGAVIGSLSSLLIDRYGFAESVAAAQVGIFMALSTAVSIPFFPLSARAASSRTPLIPITTGLAATIATALVMEYAAGQTAGRLAASAAFGVSLGSIIFTSSYLAVTLPTRVRGLGSGLSQVSSLLGVALGAPLSAAYIHTAGHQGLFIVFGAVPALAALAFSVIVRERLLRVEEPTASAELTGT